MADYKKKDVKDFVMGNKDKDKDGNEAKLKVVEALQDDAYKGIARIDPSLMKAMGLQRGDIISVKGGRETVAIVDRAYPADVGEQIIRIDGLIRKNAKTGVGEMVSVKKANVKAATKVSVAPAQKGIMVQGDPEFFKNHLIGRVVVKGDIISLGGRTRARPDVFGGPFPDFMNDMNDLFGAGFGFQQIKFVIVSTTPGQPCVITEDTQVTLNSKAVEIDDSGRSVPQVTYEDIGGLNEEARKIREMVELPLKRPEVFDRLGIEPPKGVLLYGPPGTGKTLLAKAVATESEANFILINGPEIFNKFYGESEKKIRDIFEEAEKNAPSIIFIDELDAVAPNRDNTYGSGEVERRVVAQLLTMMDGLNPRGRVVVIAATNRPDAIDSALRRPGRFDREIEINVPNKEGRLSILKIHSRNMPLAKDVDKEEIAAKTHGFVGADLAALTKEAAMSALRRVLPKMKLEDGELSKEFIESLIVTKHDFEEGLKFVQPSALREVSVEIPNITWQQIGGLDKVKEELKEAIDWPMNHPDAFKRLGVRSTRGVLLYGPPGTGKTLLAKAVATESESNFIQIDGPELQKEGVVGKETERLRKIFKRAKQVAPCVVFFDEVDSFARRRGGGNGALADSNESMLNTLLTEMDGLSELKGIVVIAATNRPDMLDPALLRPGRFDKVVLVDVPDVESRKMIFGVHLKNTPIAKDVDVDELVTLTEGFVGADVEALVREAAMHALRVNININEISKNDFDMAFMKVKASVSVETAKRYKKIEDYYLKSAKAGIDVGPGYTG